MTETPSWGTPEPEPPVWGTPQTTTGTEPPVGTALPSRRTVLERRPSEERPRVGRPARIGIAAGLAMALLGAGAFVLNGSGRDLTRPVTGHSGDGLTGLVLGECFDGTPMGGTVTPVDCGVPHDEQYVGAFQLPSGPFPGDVLVAEQSVRRCLQVFDAFIGSPLLDQNDLRLDWSLLEEDDWNRGVREVRCAVARVDGADLDGSVQA